MSETSSTIPGWFGKIPFLGDFASRRLSQTFIAPWDHWLQHSIAASRAQLGEQWLDTYLHSPIWRFALWPGVLGAEGWAGVMMPSVDSVGRYFPLTIASEIAPENFIELFSAQSWFATLEHIALSTLDMNFSVDDLERDLATNSLSFASIADTKANATNTAANTLCAGLHQQTLQQLILPLRSAQELSALLNTTALQLLDAAARGRSLWWTDAPENAATLNCFMGLPQESDFLLLLGH